LKDEAPERSLAGVNILVVEDDARNLFAMTGLLERAGASVTPATSAREAQEALHQHPNTDVVLMDIMMPETDGLHATRELRARKELEGLPVIALTAKASETDRASCFAAGCNDYVVKPVEIRQIVAVIQRHIRRGPRTEGGEAR
jgi:CheY-like chemotaxis protein